QWWRGPSTVGRVVSTTVPAAAARPDSVSDVSNEQTSEPTVTAPVEPAEPLVSDSQSFARAFKDMRDGFGQRELWLSLGWQDIKQRYRRSVLGPFWITIATGVQ